MLSSTELRTLPAKLPRDYPPSPPSTPRPPNDSDCKASGNTGEKRCTNQRETCYRIPSSSKQEAHVSCTKPLIYHETGLLDTEHQHPFNWRLDYCCRRVFFLMQVVATVTAFAVPNLHTESIMQHSRLEHFSAPPEMSARRELTKE